MGEVGGLAAGATAGGLIAAKAYSSSLMAVAAQAQLTGTAVTGMSATMSAIPVGRLIAAGAAIGTLATRIFQRGKEAEAIGAAAGTLQGVAAQNFAAIQQSADALNYQYDVQIANLSLEKDRTTNLKEIERITARIAELEQNRTAGLDALAQKQQDTINSYIGVVRNYKDDTEGVLQGLGETFTDLGAMFNFIPGVKSKDEKMLAKTMDAAVLGMQEAWNNSIGSKLLGNELQGMDIEDVIRISLLVESKTISPEQMLLLKDIAERNGKDINQVIKFTLENSDPETLGRISTLLGRFETTTKQKGFQNLTDQLLGDDPAKLKNVLTALEEYAKAPDSIPVNMGMEIDKSDIDRLAVFGKEIDAIKKRFPNGKFDVKLLQKYQTELAGAGMPANATLDYVTSNIDYFMKLPAEKRFEAIFAFTMLKDADSVRADIEKTLRIGFMKKAEQKDPATLYVDSARAAAASQYDAWRKSTAGVKAYTDALKAMGLEWKGTGIEDGSVVPGANDLGDKTKIDLSWANDLVQRLKLIKESSLDALNPLISLQKFLGKDNKKSKNPMLDEQQGLLKKLEQQSKIPLATNLVDLLKSLDPEQFKLIYKYLFDANYQLNEVGKTYNEAFKVATVAEFLQKQKESNKSAKAQIDTYKKLRDATDASGKPLYSMDSILKILQDEALALDLAMGNTFSKDEQKQFNDELEKTNKLIIANSVKTLDKDIFDSEKSIAAYEKLNSLGVKQAVIIEILKNKENALAISRIAAGDTKGLDELINKTKIQIDLVDKLAKMYETFEQKTQDAIDANIAALDLQAKTLQNQFDLANFELKAKIVVAEDAVQKINDDIQKEQDKIDKINFELKYDSKIGQNLLDDIQENINDAQRKMEIDFDRPLQALSDRSAVLSNDLTLIDKATEAINEKYDKQEAALQTISELNQEIAAQEQKRISLADALSQGDISAAAQLANEMRSTAADAANRRSGEFLAAARKAETEALVSASGMTKAQIEAEQFRISQQSYALEQQRKTIQTQILSLEDQVYNITELREVKLLAIRDVETVIDGIKANQLFNAQQVLDRLQNELDANQKILDAKLLAIDKEKLGWESIQIKLDAYKAKLTEINDGPLKTMKDIVDSIAAALSQINNAKYSKDSAFIPPPTTTATPAEVTAATKKANDAADAADAATKKAEEELNAQLAAQAKADAEAAATSAALKKAIEDTKKAIADAAKKGDPASKAYMAQQKAAQEAEAARLAALAKQNAQYAARAAGYASRGQQAAYASGGMVKPKYFAVGGKARGTDIIPAMLTPGEFVMSKYAVDSYGVDKMKAINSGSYEGEKVYNYNLNVNVKSDANPEDIARVVMTQIRQVDSQRIRTQRG
jgi:hypothetical protein